MLKKKQIKHSVTKPIPFTFEVRSTLHFEVASMVAQPPPGSDVSKLIEGVVKNHERKFAEQFYRGLSKRLNDVRFELALLDMDVQREELMTSKRYHKILQELRDLIIEIDNTPGE